MSTPPRALRLVAALALLVCCSLTAPAGEGRVTSTRLGGRAPYRVMTGYYSWVDQKRNRHLRAKIYFPAGDGLFPVIIFSHGLGNSCEGYEYLGRFWASHGYISIHPEHPGAGRDIASKGWFALFRAGFDKGYWSDLPRDVSAILDQISVPAGQPDFLRGHVDALHIGVAGHSTGAYTALAVAGLEPKIGTRRLTFRDRRVEASIALSMSESVDRDAYRDIHIPILHMTGTRDSSLAYGTTRNDRRIPFESIRSGDQYLVTIRDANHSTFSDDETPDNRWQHDVIREATLAFWDSSLKGDGNAWEWMRNGGLRDAIAGNATLEVK